MAWMASSGEASSRGYIFSTSGDGFAAAFWTPDGGLGGHRHPGCPCVRTVAVAVVIAVRMGVHTGTADERDGDYFGPTLNRAARLMSAANAGQVLLSSVTRNCSEQLMRSIWVSS